MNTQLFRCVVLAGVFSLSIPAKPQNAIAALMASKKLSNVPAAYQDKVKPGSLLTMSRDGSMSFFDADETAMPYAVEAMKGPLPTITIEYIDSKIDKHGGLSVAFLKWQPGVHLTNNTQLTSDQAVLSVAALNQDQMDELIYKDPKTLTRYEGWNPPNHARGADVYIVEAVYWATELQITNAKNRGVAASTGGTLPSCTAEPPKTDSSAGTKSDDGSKTTKTEKEQKGGQVKAVAENAGQAAAKVIAKGIVSTASAAVAAAGSTVVTISGSSCLDSADVAHLKSEKPVPVGMKVDLIGYFTGDPDKFDWSPVRPPLF